MMMVTHSRILLLRPTRRCIRYTTTDRAVPRQASETDSGRKHEGCLLGGPGPRALEYQGVAGLSRDGQQVSLGFLFIQTNNDRYFPQLLSTIYFRITTTSIPTLANHRIEVEPSHCVLSWWSGVVVGGGRKDPAILLSSAAHTAASLSLSTELST